MSEYDNTDKGVAFKPFEDQKMILQGKIDNLGQEDRYVFVRGETRSGKRIIGVYREVGVLFENDKKGNENAPDYTGPFGSRRLAAWKRSKEGRNYLTFAVSDQRSHEEQAGPAPKPQGAAVSPNHDDDIPF